MRAPERIIIRIEGQGVGEMGEPIHNMLHETEVYAGVKYLSSQPDGGQGGRPRTIMRFEIYNTPDVPTEQGCLIIHRGVKFRVFQIQHSARHITLIAHDEN